MSDTAPVESEQLQITIQSVSVRMTGVGARAEARILLGATLIGYVGGPNGTSESQAHAQAEQIVGAALFGSLGHATMPDENLRSYSHLEVEAGRELPEWWIAEPGSFVASEGRP